MTLGEAEKIAAAINMIDDGKGTAHKICWALNKQFSDFKFVYNAANDQGVIVTENWEFMEGRPPSANG